MKVLLSAYACEPNQGSEPGIGWNWVIQAARFHEVWVITRRSNREAIEAKLDRAPLPGVHWIYVDLPAWARFWKKGQRGLRTYYHLWQAAGWLAARRLHAEIKFDVAHHVTFGTYWLPSFLALLPIPFIWGPVGGGESCPYEFVRPLSLVNRTGELLRDYGRRWAEHSPLIGMTARRAKIVFATTEESGERVAFLKPCRVEILSHVALSREDQLILERLPPRSGRPFRLASIGRLIYWKGFHIGLEAFASLLQDLPDSQYMIIGEGPERQRLEILAIDLGIGESVLFCGHLSRNEVHSKLAECDVLVHPSFHDSGGYVCVEAMAAGRPVVCLNLGGPALQVTDDTGFKIKAQEPRQAIKEFSDALRVLALDSELRLEMGRAAQQRVRDHFRWDLKGDYMKQVYAEVFQGREKIFDGGLL
jgi:glycosyltransferase involved in cell wall biosynthesis